MGEGAEMLIFIAIGWAIKWIVQGVGAVLDAWVDPFDTED